MKRLLLFALVALISCKKETTLPIDRNVTVKAAVQDGRATDGLLYWKPGLIFSRGINATGTATVKWYFGGNPGFPWATYEKVLKWTVTENSNGYFELSNNRLPDPSLFADSARVTAFTITSGDYNVTIDNR